MIIGINGQARSGKDTIANYLVKERGFVRIGFADEMKRFCREVYLFNNEQLWGDKRDVPDRRYPRKCGICGGIGDPDMICTRHEGFLTPRYALQTLGTEWGRNCYNNTWIDWGIRTAEILLGGRHTYNEDNGLRYDAAAAAPRGVVFSDVRFRNELDGVINANGTLVRVKRPGADGRVGIAGHASESEQQGIADEEFDHIINNTGTLEDLYRKVDAFL